MGRIYVSLLLLSIGSFSTVVARPRYVECQDSIECGSFACCVIGTKLYSLPKCMPYLSSGERCSDRNFMSSNKTVVYPDQVQVAYTNVHLIQCPCEPGLSCGYVGSGGGNGGGVGSTDSRGDDSSAFSVCYDPLMMDNLNSISNSVYDHY